MRKFKISFGCQDKYSELFIEGAILGFFFLALIKDVQEKSWWGLFDAGMVVWSYVNARKITKQLRSNTDDNAKTH